MADARKENASARICAKVSAKRNRAWRRAQNRRIIQKRLKILTRIWGYGTEEYGLLREQKCPGLLRKWNFTHDCGCRKMDRMYREIDLRKIERDRERCMKDEYDSDFD